MEYRDVTLRWVRLDLDAQCKSVRDSLTELDALRTTSESDVSEDVKKAKVEAHISNLCRINNQLLDNVNRTTDEAVYFMQGLEKMGWRRHH